jgi:predicted nucleic acid-binding protein
MFKWVRLLFDTSVTLDALLERDPYAQDMQPLWQKAAAAEVSAFVSATTLTDVYYVSRKTLGKEGALRAVGVCLGIFEICDVDRSILEYAYTLPGSDFEDNVQIACAVHLGLNGIVTRDKKGFKHSPVAVYTPGEALSALSFTQSS